MIESRLARLRASIEPFLENSPSARLHPCATETQIAAYEKTLGLRLPGELRAFLLEVGDGMELKLGGDTDLVIFPLIGGQDWPSSSRARLVVFPIQKLVKGKPRSSSNPAWGIHSARAWSELSGHEQMENEVALHFATSITEEAFLVLSGSRRGQVCFADMWRGSQEPHCLPFFDSLDFLLGAPLRARIQSVGNRSGHLQMHPPATREQVAAYEKTLGLRLPDELREFVCGVADGFKAGYDVSITMLSLFGDIPSYSSEIRPRLVVFPIQQLLTKQGVNPPKYPIAGTKYARGWDELSGREQAHNEVALHFGFLEGEEVILVLSGPGRGSVRFTSRFGGLSKTTPPHMTFLQALDYLLDKAK